MTVKGKKMDKPGTNQGSLKTGDTEMFKLVTFNIRCDYGQDGVNNFQYRKELIMQKLEQQQPDVICFQEVLPHVADWLKETLAAYYVVGCGREKAFNGEQMTVAFRKDRMNLIAMDTFWLSPDEYCPGSRYAQQSDCPRTCTELVLEDMESKRVFRLMNTHLDHQGAKARELGLAQILKRIHSQQFLPDIPVLLAGDFNAEPDSEEMLMLQKENVMNLTQDIGITFHGFLPEEKPEKIDYIFLFNGKDKEQQLEPEKTEKWEDREGEVWLSDHYPICAWLKWKNQE